MRAIVVCSVVILDQIVRLNYRRIKFLCVVLVEYRVMKDYIIRKIQSKYRNKYKYTYYDTENHKVNQKIVKICLDGLYIPPAHDDVKISLNKKDKVLAIGYDTKGRAQYIYNKKYTKEQSDKKYDHMIEFGESYKKIIYQINQDLYTEKDTKNKQIAQILKIVINCCFRIGNDKYAKENKSYGVSTLKSEHIKISKDNITIDFIGKKGVRNTCSIKNKKLSKNLRKKKKTLKKDDRIFSYRKKNKYYKIKSTDVNQYLKRFGDFTTKNFRTWNANIELITQLLKMENDDTITQRKKNISEAVSGVAHKLHNTSSVCKKNYIDPYLIETYIDDIERFSGSFKDAFSKEEINDAYIRLLKHRI